MSWQLWVMLNIAIVMAAHALVYRKKFASVFFTLKGFGAMTAWAILGYLAGFMVMVLTLDLALGVAKDQILRHDTALDLSAVVVSYLAAHVVMSKPRWFGIKPRGNLYVAENIE